MVVVVVVVVHPVLLHLLVRRVAGEVLAVEVVRR